MSAKAEPIAQTYHPYLRVCTICADTSHPDEECPHRHCATLYHGTKISNLSQITLTSLCASGRLGPGLYLTGFNAAKCLSKTKTKEGTCSAIFHIECNLGAVCHVPDGSDNPDVGENWQRYYDSARATHRPWKGVQQYYSEFCVKNLTRCRILGVELISGSIKGEPKLQNGGWVKCCDDVSRPSAS